MPPASGLRERETPPESSVSFLGSSGWDQCPPLLSHSSCPVGSLLPTFPVLLLPPASLLCSQDAHGPEGASEGVGPGPRARQTSPAEWAGDTLGVLPTDPSPQGSLQAWEPLPRLSHPSEAPVLSGLRFSSPPQSPHILPVCLGVTPDTLDIEVPHQRPAGALVMGDTNSVSSHTAILIPPHYL